MKMWKLSLPANLQLLILCVGIFAGKAVADFLLDKAEADTICHRVDGSYSDTTCAITCSGDCEEIGAKDSHCAPLDSLSKLCCCKKYIRLKYAACQKRCRSYVYDSRYFEDTMACRCICSASICSKHCDKELKIGKCQNSSLQQPMKNPCTCYCDETCVSMYSTPYVNSSCNENGQCIKICNGTQDKAPSWCELDKDKCGCKCSNTRCQNFCKNKTTFGICQSTSSCSCQDSMLADKDCSKYCTDRTKAPPITLPSKSGHCKCKYTQLDFCSTECTSSKSCSPIDGCFCQDTQESLKLADLGTNHCQENLCYNEELELDDSKLYFQATEKQDGEVPVICIAYARNTIPLQIAVPGVVLVEKFGDDISIDEITCMIAYTNQNNVSQLLNPYRYCLLEGNQSYFKFEKMKQNGKIPKGAMKLRGRYYLGRAFGGQVIGTIDEKGVMTGGNITLKAWTSQSPIYPRKFEIFVCKQQLKNLTQISVKCL